jgi:hypothetical protein
MHPSFVSIPITRDEFIKNSVYFRKQIAFFDWMRFTDAELEDVPVPRLAHYNDDTVKDMIKLYAPHPLDFGDWAPVISS